MKTQVVWWIFAMVSEGHAANEMFSYQIQLIPTLIYGPPPHRQSFTEVVYALMNNSIQLSIQQVQLIQSKIEVIYSQALNQIMQSQRNSNDIFDKILSDYKKLFKSVHNQVHPCVQKNMEVMRNITSDGRDNALSCVNSATNEISRIQESVSPYSESINLSIENINKVSEQCTQSSDPIWIGICTLENLETVSNSVAGIIRDLKESSKVATVEVFAIEQNVQKCIERAIISIRKPVEDIVSTVKVCATQ